MYQINFSDEGEQSDVNATSDKNAKKDDNSSRNPDFTFVFEDKDDQFYWFDDEPTITMSDDDTDIGESTSPLYQNQEGDPKVQQMIFQQQMEDYDEWTLNFEIYRISKYLHLLHLNIWIKLHLKISSLYMLQMGAE